MTLYAHQNQLQMHLYKTETINKMTDPGGANYLPIFRQENYRYLNIFRELVGITKQFSCLLIHLFIQRLII